jgi:hypothetical protein
MAEGPLGFPRLTDIGPFATVGSDDINDDRIKRAADKFKPRFNIEDSKGNDPYPKWDRADTKESGVTGLWIKNKEIMVIEPRSGRLSKVHTEIAQELYERLDYNELEVMPWSTVKTRRSIRVDEGWHADINSVGESMNNDYVRDILNISTTTATPSDLWPVVYTLWLTNHPYSTTTRYNYLDGEGEVFQLASAYRELSFSLGGLPEPKIRRTDDD